MTTRRDVLKFLGTGGLVLGAPYLLTSRKRALIADAYGQMASGGTLASPPITPFVTSLPIPAVKAPVTTLSPAPDTSRFQYYNQYPANELYEVEVKEALHSFHPSLPLNPVWNYDG